jgi:CRISPR system Cascade subunit CasC
VRTSDIFTERLYGHLGSRTQRLGEEIEKRLVTKGHPAEQALAIARKVGGVFGQLAPENEDNPARIRQLAFVSPQEQETAFALAERMAAGERVEPDASILMRRADAAADIAMFGRMLADNPDYNREAAVQVAHAITTHRVTIEDDYYTAVDDLKTAAEDAGAGFVGELGFGSGVFYLYVCIDVAMLLSNLGGNRELARTAVEALIEALATVSPGGKQASFASRARASFILAEHGDGQPRTLAGAFLKPITGDNPMRKSIESLREFREKMEAAYGASTSPPTVLDVEGGEGKLVAVIASAVSALE